MYTKTLNSKAYKLRRGIRRVIFSPIRFFREGDTKNYFRKHILKSQHSLPVELAINKGDTVVQIGTPWPKTIDRFLKSIGPKGKLIVFEANPVNHATLETHINDNGITNAILIHGAACNETGMGKLLLSPHPGDHKIDISGIKMDNDLRLGNESMEETSVNFYRIDDILKEHSIEKVDYLSVTVNGAEIEVLKGAKSTLINSNSLTRVYAKGHALDSNNNPINVAIAQLLSDFGFESVITKGEQSSSDCAEWTRRAGDVFAWKP